MEDNYNDFESGPFCPHWGEEGCDDICATCGHTCEFHGVYDRECRECECSTFKDK